MTSQTDSTTTQRLPFLTKLIYGFGDWGNTTTVTIFGFFFAFFLNNVAGLQPIYAAPVLLAGGIWDAVNDPLIGSLADRVRTRWGRRRPFFLFGAIPFAITFIMLWWVPPIASQVGKAMYYAVAYILFDTMFTIVSVPYAALTPELTDDYDDRTRLNGFRAGVSMVGGLISAVAVPMVVDAFVNKQTGYMLIAVVFGSLAAVPYFLLFFRIKERFADIPGKMELVKGFLTTWKNRAFRYVAGIYLTSWATIALAGALFQYYVTFWLRMPGEVDIVLGLMMLSTTICIPLMVFIANRLNKQRAYILATSFWVVVMLGISFLPRDAGTLVYYLAAAVGIGVASAHVVTWSIIPDTIESDELETGMRREATYYGFIVFLQKCGSAFLLAIMQWVLQWSGYVIPADPANPLAVMQPDSALAAIRIMIGPVPAVLLVISILLMLRYPISREKHAEMVAKLQIQRSAAITSEIIEGSES